MKITREWLDEKNACNKGKKWFIRQEKADAVDVINALIAEERLDWANWIIVRIMKRNQFVAYAIYAAEQVVGIYEGKYPGDDRPRRAIEAAKAVLKKASEKNKAAADADCAAYAVFAAYADCAVFADCAAYMADCAADAVFAAFADCAAYADCADRKKEIQTRILKYGLTLLVEP